jgi:hypothetical protein
VKRLSQFLTVEIKPIFNSRILELEGSIRSADPSENLFFFVFKDKIVTRPAISEIIQKIDLGQLEFRDKNQFCQINNRTNLIIFYNIEKTHAMPLEAEQVFNTFMSIKNILHR